MKCNKCGEMQPVYAEIRTPEDRALIDAAFEWKQAYAAYLNTPDCGRFQACECYKEEVNKAHEKLSQAIQKHPDYKAKDA